MTDGQLNDPHLQALEARLAAVVPRATLPEQHELLYQCGFAAGRESHRTTVTRWRALAATFLLVSIGLSIPLAQQTALSEVAEQPPATPAELPPTRVTAEPVLLLAAARPHLDPLALDAWQVPASIESMPKIEPAHPLAVGSLTRSLLSQHRQ